MNGNPQASNRKPIFNIGLAGEAGFLLTFREQPSPALTDYILRIAEHLSAQYGALITDVAPAYKTLAIFYDARHPNALALHTHLIAMGRENAAEQSRNTGPPETEQTPAHNRPLDTVTALSTGPQQHIALPVYYDVEVAPDLSALAAHAALSVEQIITLHTEQTYTAYANGFAPGFCYLGHVDKAIATPRHATPRAAVAAGSVAIADRQTAVYPRQSPGGWHIIGRCPIVLFDANTQPPNTINVGDTVRFYAVDRQQFVSLGGTL